MVQCDASVCASCALLVCSSAVAVDPRDRPDVVAGLEVWMLLGSRWRSSLKTSRNASASFQGRPRRIVKERRAATPSSRRRSRAASRAAPAPGPLPGQDQRIAGLLLTEGQQVAVEDVRRPDSQSCFRTPNHPIMTMASPIDLCPLCRRSTRKHRSPPAARGSSSASEAKVELGRRVLLRWHEAWMVDPVIAEADLPKKARIVR